MLQLWVTVYEGDHAVTRRGVLGALLGRTLTKSSFSTSATTLRDFNQHPQQCGIVGRLVPTSSGADERWSDVVRALEEGSFTLQAEDGMLVSELTKDAHRKAQVLQLADPPDHPVPVELSHSDSWMFFRNPIIDVWLADAGSGERYDSHLTLRDAGIEDGSDVILYVMHSTYNQYFPWPAPNAQALLCMLDIVTRDYISNTPRLWGALLYTSEDVALAKYVREHFDDLNLLTGPLFGIFTVEKPVNPKASRRYWSQHLDERLFRVYRVMQWLSWKPYEKSECYEIARVLHIPPEQLPCLALFDDLNETIVFPTPKLEEYSPYFRRLFSLLAEAAGEASHDDYIEQRFAASRWREMGGLATNRDSPPRETFAEMLAQLPGTSRSFETLFSSVRRWNSRPDEYTTTRRIENILAGRGVKQARERIVASLEVDTDSMEADRRGETRRWLFYGQTVFVNNGEAVTDNFNFYGTTNFVNRPVDTVISDFQNSYGCEAKAAPELGELLRLVLTSEELSVIQKEEAAELVHQAAGEISASETEAVATVPGKMERLKAIVSASTGIGTPIVELASKVIGLFN
jgi:hypothetical protein